MERHLHQQTSVDIDRLLQIMICFIPFFATEEGPFGAEAFC